MFWNITLCKSWLLLIVLQAESSGVKFPESKGAGVYLRSSRVRKYFLQYLPYLEEWKGDWKGGSNPPDFVIVGSLSNNDGNYYKNITSKVNSFCFKLYLTFSILFNSANNGTFFWSWIPKGYVEVQKKKKEIAVLCWHPLQNMKLVIVMQGQQRNVQKRMMHMQSCCFANLKLLLFCHSRCHCRHRWLSCLISSVRKQPTFHYATNGIPMKWHLRNKHRNSIIWWCVTTLIWVVLLIGRKFASTNKKNFSDLDFCTHSSDVISQGNRWWYCETNAQVQVCLNGLLW